MNRTDRLDRRRALKSMAALTAGGLVLDGLAPPARAIGHRDPQVRKAVRRGLDWVAKTQSPRGQWDANNQYRVPMTALAGIALSCEGSTTTQGRYARNIRRAVDYLFRYSRSNGLIGDPTDRRYTYGHGFSMLFLSQVLGEEEDAGRRADLIDVLTKAVEFSGNAQADSGGWGYVSAKDQPNFDEGSTTITQVQGLRGCRNAGIPVPKEIIDKAVKYIRNCSLQNGKGGVTYSSRNRSGGRPAISAAAIATLFSAGEYKSEYVKNLLDYCKRHLGNVNAHGNYHWHYTHYYYSQVMYRLEDEWPDYRDKIYQKLLKEQTSNGSWQGNIGPIYVSSINLTILQLENAFLPIYQR